MQPELGVSGPTSRPTLPVHPSLKHTGCLLLGTRLHAGTGLSGHKTKTLFRQEGPQSATNVEGASLSHTRSYHEAGEAGGRGWGRAGPASTQREGQGLLGLGRGVWKEHPGCCVEANQVGREQEGSRLHPLTADGGRARAIRGGRWGWNLDVSKRQRPQDFPTGWGWWAVLGTWLRQNEKERGASVQGCGKCKAQTNVRSLRTFSQKNTALKWRLPPSPS